MLLPAPIFCSKKIEVLIIKALQLYILYCSCANTIFAGCMVTESAVWSLFTGFWSCVHVLKFKSIDFQ